MSQKNDRRRTVGEETVHASVRITPRQEAECLAVGKGNLSEGARILLARGISALKGRAKK